MRLGHASARDDHTSDQLVPQPGGMPRRQSTPAERTLQARAAAHVRWAGTADRTAATAPARAALEARFEREVDPDGLLPPGERIRRAEHARRAYYAHLALRSARARRRGEIC